MKLDHGWAIASYIKYWMQLRVHALILVNLRHTMRTPELISLRWHHNGRDCVSNHQPHHCLLNSLFGCRSKKTSKFRVTGLCAGNSPGTRKMFPFDDVIMWWTTLFETLRNIQRQILFEGLCNDIVTNTKRGQWITDQKRSACVRQFVDASFQLSLH